MPGYRCPCNSGLASNGNISALLVESRRRVPSKHPSGRPNGVYITGTVAGKSVRHYMVGFGNIPRVGSTLQFGKLMAVARAPWRNTGWTTLPCSKCSALVESSSDEGERLGLPLPADPLPAAIRDLLPHNAEGKREALVVPGSRRRAPAPATLAADPPAPKVMAAPGPDTTDGEYAVSDFLAFRTEAGVDQLLIKWEGYTEPTWEPRDNVDLAELDPSLVPRLAAARRAYAATRGAVLKCVDCDDVIAHDDDAPLCWGCHHPVHAGCALGHTCWYCRVARRFA